jgi:hypothetical protein
VGRDVRGRDVRERMSGEGCEGERDVRRGEGCEEGRGM